MQKNSRTWLLTQDSRRTSTLVVPAGGAGGAGGGGRQGGQGQQAVSAGTAGRKSGGRHGADGSVLAGSRCHHTAGAPAPPSAMPHFPCPTCCSHPTCELRHLPLPQAHEGVAGLHLLRHQRPRGRHKHHLALQAAQAEQTGNTRCKTSVAQKALTEAATGKSILTADSPAPTSGNQRVKLCMTTAAISVLPSPVGRHTSVLCSSAVCTRAQAAQEGRTV